MSAMSLLFPSRSNPDPYDLNQYEREIVDHGLANEQEAINDAMRNTALFELDGVAYIPSRGAETSLDKAERPKRESGLTFQIVSILCEHQYSPGPTRTFDDEAGEEFLEQVYEQNHINSIFDRANQLATLNDYCAIQVDAAEGDYEEKPITLRLWPREDLVVFCHPNDSRLPVAVATLDRYDLSTTIRLWNHSEVRTYKTQKATGTSGGRAATRVSIENHEYGCLPFSFVHADLPTTKFCTPGIGDFAARAELQVNDLLSRIGESVVKHLNPIPVARDVPADWNPVLGPMRFIRLVSSGKQNTGAAGYQQSGDPSLSYLETKIDIEGAWADVAHYVVQVLEAARVPQSYYRMEQTDSQSGIAIIMEQLPLLMRAKKRRHPFGVFENCLAKLILLAAGNHYNNPALVTASKGMLTLGWEEYKIPVGLPARGEIDAADLALGTKSLTQVIMEREGCTREKAKEILKQIQVDKEFEALVSGTGLPPQVVGAVGPTGVARLAGQGQLTGPAGSEEPGAGTDPDEIEGGGDDGEP